VVPYLFYGDLFPSLLEREGPKRLRVSALKLERQTASIGGRNIDRIERVPPGDDMEQQGVRWTPLSRPKKRFP
jgi:hypothetical protein